MFASETSIYRGLRAEGVADFEAVETTQFFTRALADGRLVATERVEPTEAGLADWPVVLRHERLDLISYPYEWSFTMLRDAALLQLELTREALSEGCITKDATPFNIQFVGTRPVFIDIGSFEPYRDGDPWFGYEQFCQLFLNPLLLQAYCEVDFQPILRGRLTGITPGEIRNLLSRRDRLRRGMFGHVVFHARAQARYAATGGDMRSELKAAGFGSKLIEGQLRGLERMIRSLAWGDTGSSTWSDYSDRSHYEEAGLASKEAFVRRVSSQVAPRWVVDLGANDGRFSAIAAESGASVVAVDGDHLVVDRLYRRLREDDNDQILPLVMDLSDPSPATGWRSREREEFPPRVEADLVLALAVVHHLAISATVPIEEIVAWLADFEAPVVLEVPHRDDPMVRRLLSNKRPGLFDHYDLATFESAIASAFEVDDREELESRTMFWLSPRRG